MGINVRREEQWGTGKKLFAWLCIVVVAVLFSIGYGKSMDDISLRYCAGAYNTPECHKDRNARKAAEYARKKAESL